MASLKLYDRKTRRGFLAILAIPPIVGAITSWIAPWSLQASIALMVASILTLIALQFDLTTEALAESDRAVDLYRNDHEVMPRLIELVHANHPREVQMLEYSGIGAIPLLDKLAEVGSTVSIRLLVAHPASAISRYQRTHRLAEGLRMLAYAIPEKRALQVGLQVKCYRERASMRGRRVGERTLVVGWYTYEDRGMPDEDEGQMSGGTNCLVGVDATTELGGRLEGTYSRVFESLWAAAEQPDEAWAAFRSEAAQLPSEAWLKAVRGRDG